MNLIIVEVMHAIGFCILIRMYIDADYKSFFNIKKYSENYNYFLSASIFAIAISGVCCLFIL